MVLALVMCVGLAVPTFALTLLFRTIVQKGWKSCAGDGASKVFISAHRLSVELVRSICNDSTETTPTKSVGHGILHGGAI